MPDNQQTYPSDIEIARSARTKPITEIGRTLGIGPEDLVPYGADKAKVRMDFVARVEDQPLSKLVLVTAISPTPAGEGKTTTTVGLGDALSRIGKRAVICLREPSLGPCFGMKGGAAGGGRAQVVPMEDINLHFTGDFHAIGAAHNLLAAAIDNHLHWGNALGLDPRRITWRRVLDLNERALRDIVVGLGGTGNSIPRETGFDITAASEVMAILTLASSRSDLRERLGRIVVGQTYDSERISASDLNVHGAMATLLKDAISPNLVQTLENTPAFIHGGPFANIAHGCNSVLATKLAQRVSEYTVTEAGFGADLGAEKFFDIKCGSAGLRPDVAVIVATIRALKLHGGVAQADLGQSDPGAVEVGIEHLERHVRNLRRFGVPVIVCVNAFVSDSEQETAVLLGSAERLGVPVVRASHWEHGGAGAEELAHAVVERAESGQADFRPLYTERDGLLAKVERVAQDIYGARGVVTNPRLRKTFERLEQDGYGHLPVCIAKTQYSFSTDPSLKGCPSDFDIPIRSIELRAGAGFILVLTGTILTMPGLPRVPAAESIDVDADGRIEGLF
ncbi:MAG: formate--tetrahydrofolate ligase [Chlamydiales bacterium]|jgi:formate--tetrahydrofolate ligase